MLSSLSYIAVGRGVLVGAGVAVGTAVQATSRRNEIRMRMNVRDIWILFPFSFLLFTFPKTLF